MSQAVPQVQVVVGQSLLGGYYYEVQGWEGELSELAALVTTTMADMVEKAETAHARCDFCNRAYEVAPDELAALYRELTGDGRDLN